jgi:hypothetical protein
VLRKGSAREESSLCFAERSKTPFPTNRALLETKAFAGREAEAVISHAAPKSHVFFPAGTYQRIKG